MPITKEYITLNIDDIIPYENNPRINDDAVAGVVESIKQCGELDPIEVDENQSRINRWLCNKCGRAIYKKPYKNMICQKNGCVGRFKRETQCNCGKWFANSSGDKKYCSHKCLTKYKDVGYRLIKCCFCGKETLKYKSSIKGGKNFCDLQCMRNYEKTLTQKRKCHYCGKEFYVYKSALRTPNTNGKYCSRDCCDKAKIMPYKEYDRGNFEEVKAKYFSYPQFCAICGTTKNIHIHHIIPYRLTQDNSPSNLVPLCIKHHPEYEKASLGFIELMKDDYETAKVMLNNMWRAKQRVTMQVIRRILSERKPTTN